MSLFARASAGYALSAVERTALRFLKSLWLTVLLATLPVLSGLMQALNTNAFTVDWQAWGYRLLAAVGTSAALAIQKYFSAQGDTVPAQAAPVASTPIPPPPASNAPVTPSYMTTLAPGVTVSLPMPNTATSAPSTVTLNPTVSNLPTPAADTPTLTVPKVASATPTVSATTASAT